MGICSAFQTRAQSQGLIAPASPDTLRGNSIYKNLMAAKSEHQARVDRYTASYLRDPSLRQAAARLDAEGKKVSTERLARSQAVVLDWADALARLDNDGTRADALVPQASQALTFFYSGVMEYAHANLPAWVGEYCKIDRQVDRAAEEYVWYEMDLVGVPKAANSYSTMDIPMVAGPAAQANKGQIVPFLVGMEVNFMDLRRSLMAKANGKPDFQIDQSKIKTCHRVLAEAVNFLWLYGDPVQGIDGLMNNPGIGVLAINGAWSGKTALQILDDLNAMINIIPNSTQGQLRDMRRIKIMLPPDQYNRAQALPITAAGSESVLSYFRKIWSLRDDQVVRQYDLAAANTALWIGGPQGLTRDRAVILYDQGDDMRDPMFILSQDIEIPAPPRQNGLSETTFFHVRAGGLKLPDARGIRFAEGL